MSGLFSLLRSRKFWLAAVTLAALIVKELFNFDVDTEAVVGAIMVIIGLIASIAYEDAHKALPLYDQGPK